MKGFKTGLILLGVIIAIMFFPGKKAQAKFGLSGNEIKLGFLNPFSGPGAEFGPYNQVALNMALEEINTRGGVAGLPLKVITYDTHSKPEDGINAAIKLAESDKVLAIEGPFLSSEARVVFPVCNRLQITCISSGSAAEGIGAANRPWAFRNTMTSERTLEPAFKKFIEHYRLKKAGIIYDNKDVISKTEAQKVFPELFTKFGIENLLSVSFQTSDIDFSTQVTKLRMANPDGIILSALYQEGANLVREIRKQGMKQPIMIGIGPSTPGFLRLGGKAAEGVISAQSFWAQNPAENVRKFVEEYTAKSRQDYVPLYVANIYDTVYIIKKIIEESGVTNRPEELASDRTKIRDGWANLKGYKGVSGLTSIGPDGDARKDVYIIIVKDGKFQRWQ